jgi:hypothetical protein
LEDCEQKQLLTHYGVASKTTTNTLEKTTRVLWTQKLNLIHVNAYIQSHAGVHVSRTHLQEHVVDMCRVLISVPTSPDRTFGNAETPRENKI